MWEAIGPPLKTLLAGMFLVGLAIVVLQPPDLDGLERLLSILAGAGLIVVIAAWAVVRLSGETMPEPEFRRLVDRSEALASLPPPAAPPSDFDELVIAALDELPPDFQAVLQKVPVVVSDRGREHRAYGHYIGDTVARENYPDHIVIYQDTLERDFGHDPDLLRAQVVRTVRHEIAHHLGWNEAGVRGLGL
jgi:predicted Zn-dependent protease with MMP-like domain